MTRDRDDNVEANVDPLDNTAGQPAAVPGDPTPAAARCCPVETLLRRLACSAPNDAADRLLAGLTPERVSGELSRAELSRVAGFMIWPSLFLAVFGVASAIGSLLHGHTLGHRRHHGEPARALDAAPVAPTASEAPSSSALEVEARAIAVPFAGSSADTNGGDK